MIGNDIIDLAIPISPNWNTNRYLNKVFSSAEQSAILNESQPEFFLQLFWSLKEATYKAHQRRFNLPRKYNPLDFYCEIISEADFHIKAEVKIDGDTYFCSSHYNNNWIHSIAKTSQKLHFSANILKDYISVKNDLLTKYAGLLKSTENIFSIEKNENNIPILYSKNQRLEQAFSLSHHGNFAAFVIALTNS